MPPTATRAPSPTRIGATCAATACRTSLSASACTSASASRWRASRGRAGGGAGALAAGLAGKRHAAAMDRLDGAARSPVAAGQSRALMSDADRLPPRLWWVLAGLTFAWGFNWSAMKIALHEITPWVFRSRCLGLGSAVLFLVLRAGGQKVTVPAGQWRRLALRAFFN